MPVSPCKSQKSVRLTRKPYRLTPLFYVTYTTVLMRLEEYVIESDNLLRDLLAGLFDGWAAH